MDFFDNKEVIIPRRRAYALFKNKCAPVDPFLYVFIAYNQLFFTMT